jgi:alkylhydroperoxidase family enzyme
MTLEPAMLELVRLRASQINGCAEQPQHALDAWEDTPLYTDRERAALAWTEAVTLIYPATLIRPTTLIPRAVFEEYQSRAKSESATK